MLQVDTWTLCPLWTLARRSAGTPGDGRGVGVLVATIYRAIESGHLDVLKLGAGRGMLRVTGAAVVSCEQSCMQAAYRSWFPGGTASDVEQSSRGEVAAEGGAA